MRLRIPIPVVCASLAILLAGSARAQVPCNLTWTSAPVDPLFDHGVSVLQVFDDGSGTKLYAGGTFTLASGSTARAIARFDGTSWTQVGAGLLSQVLALCIYDDGGGSKLYASGSFHHDGAGNALSRIARWDGVNWLPLGSGMAVSPGGNPYAGCMAVFDDGNGPALYAGGGFTIAGGVPANHIAKWNGTSWSALGSGVAAPAFADVRHMIAYDDGSGPALYVGGNFTTAGGVSAPGLARWNGTQWSAVGTGLANQNGLTPGVEDLEVFDFGSGDELVVMGAFNSAGGQLCANVARWSPAGWSALQHSFSDGIQVLHTVDFGASRMLAVSSGGTLSRWNEQVWTDLPGFFGVPPSVTYPPNSLVVFDSGLGAGPELYASGGFTQISGQPITGLARLPGFGAPPVVVQQPASQSIPDGLSVTFHANVIAAPPVSFQWTWFGQALHDNGNITGSTTDTLSIAGVGPSLAGDYVLEITSGCLTGQSAIAVLTVTPGTGQSLCFGDLTEPGITSFCPCFNFGSLGRGCANSAVPAGARLVATGSTALDPGTGTDTVQLTCEGMTNTAAVIFLQGSALTNGAILGDGVRCAGGTLVRLGLVPAPLGQATFPVAGGPSLSNAGGITLGSGVSRYYQVWYRDPASFCTALTYNISSATRLVW